MMLNLRLEKLSPLVLRVTAFILCFSVILIRSLPRLHSAHLWAEDGAVFLQDYLSEGFINSIIKPYSGYYHTIPRILIAIFANISIDYVPHLIIIASSFFYALIASLIVSKGYSYLLPNVSYRFIIAIVLCLLPGTWEVIGDLADLHCILVLFLLMWGMRSLEEKKYLVSGDLCFSYLWFSWRSSGMLATITHKNFNSITAKNIIITRYCNYFIYWILDNR